HHPEDYVHRIGRTGRALSVGDAFTIMTGEDLQEIAAIERFIGQKIPRVKLEGFAYEYTRLLDKNPPPAFGARRPRGSWSFGYCSRGRYPFPPQHVRWQQKQNPPITRAKDSVPWF